MAAIPSAERRHIVLIGRTNSGKSSLINQLSGHDTALVSPIAGTTTDPVRKAVELPELGACVLVDTAGFDDTSPLGPLRTEKSREALHEADLVLCVLAAPDLSLEREWLEAIKGKGTPLLIVLNKRDTIAYPPAFRDKLTPYTSSIIEHSTLHDTPLSLYSSMAQLLSTGSEQEPTIVGQLVSPGDVVLLVMPQDAAAPKGRLILPQVQTLRELLDRSCLPICCTHHNIEEALRSLSAPPRLIITDSQVFQEVYPHKPEGTLLTSFSILFAAYKGDMAEFVAGARAIDRLTPSSRVLIAEACAHAPDTEDIGRVKIPRLLRQRVGEGLTIEYANGKAFPADLTPYDLVIHCGACMFTRQLVLTRTAQAQAQQVSITNYGIAIAHLTGILPHVSW